MHFANLVTDAGVEKDALGRRGLAGIDVGHDAEVAVALDWSGACHDVTSGMSPIGLQRAPHHAAGLHAPDCGTTYQR